MEVILKQDVKHLGSELEVVKVRPGYGRNYLIPNGLAELATVPAKKMLAETLKQKAHKIEKIRTEALSVADRIKEASISVGAKVGESGKIFGSVNSIQIAESIKNAIGSEVDRKNITIHGDTIKAIGTYNATLKIAKDVSVDFTFNVVEE